MIVNARISLLAAALSLVAVGCSGSDAPDAAQEASATSAPSAEPGSQSQTQLRPVMYGGESQLDACASIGTIAGLTAESEGYLPVRASPHASAAEVARLNSGYVVSQCDSADDWLGIVFDGPDDLNRCGTGTPIAERVAYPGPCRSGWVEKRFVEIVAG